MKWRTLSSDRRGPTLIVVEGTNGTKRIKRLGFGTNTRWTVYDGLKYLGSRETIRGAQLLMTEERRD